MMMNTFYRTSAAGFGGVPNFNMQRTFGASGFPQNKFEESAQRTFVNSSKAGGLSTSELFAKNIDEDLRNNKPDIRAQVGG